MDAQSNTENKQQQAHSGISQLFIIMLTISGVLLAVHQLFNLQMFNIVLIEGRYLYLLGAIFLSLTFVCFRINGEKTAPVPWYDWTLAAMAIAVMGYFAVTAEISLDSGWEYAAPFNAVLASVLGYFLILEGTRRAGGNTIFC